MIASVLLTRPAGSEAELGRRLTDMGFRVHAVPTVLIEPALGPLPATAGFDWVVVTSPNGARRLRGLELGSSSTRWAAVGAATAEALAEIGVNVDVVPLRASAMALPEAMAALRPLRGDRVLLLRGDLAGSELPRELERLGAEVVDEVVYHTRIGPPQSRAELELALGDPGLRAVILASGSAAEGVCLLHGSAPSVGAITIGPRTSSEAARLGFKILAEASQPGLEGLLRATVEHLG
ncbi:MAG TPA: uroporphyrinogen-III synthase [Candidatus Nitrosotalea sp.]|nr:uroporphyrinogen-III synthase [Candidatus Nitrosotalea sp.]